MGVVDHRRYAVAVTAPNRANVGQRGPAGRPYAALYELCVRVLRRLAEEDAASENPGGEAKAS